MKKLLTLLLVLMTVNAWATDEWDKARLAGTTLINDIDAETQAQNAAIDRLLANYREGMTLTYSSGATIVVSSGEVVCSNSAGTVRKFRQNTSSTNVTFSDIDTGAEASATTYYVYANCDADATTATFKVSTSSSSPSGLTYYKRLGSFYNDSSSNITRINNDSVVNEFGAYESKTDGATYQATTDGVFIGVVTCGSTTSVGKVVGYTDNSSSPTTVMGAGNCILSTGTISQTSASNVGSFSFPVKQGDYYKGALTSSYSGSTATAAFYFVPKN